MIPSGRLTKIWYWLSAGAVCGCMSVSFKAPPPQKSAAVIFNPPKGAFAEISSPHLDHSWQNKASGSTISYLSDCNNPTDPSLENIFKGITSEIDGVSVINSNRFTYNAREALRSRVAGLVDGVKTNFELIIFKKNNCTYILTFVTMADGNIQDENEFTNFLKGFVVP